MGFLRLTLLALVVCGFALCQSSLDNAIILKLVKAGIGENTIVGMVNQLPGRYALSSDDVIVLKTAGVSDKVIAAMIVKNGAGTASSTPATAANTTISSTTPPNSNQPNRPNDGLTRVYVTDSQSWETRGGWSAGGHTNSDGSGSWGGGGYQAGGARPQTAEIIKTFNQRCSGVTITNNSAKADFAVILDHEGGKGYAHRRNKIVVFNREGDDIFSDSTRTLGNSVKDACQAILSHTGSRQHSTAVGSPSAGAMSNAFGPAPAAPLPSVLAANTPAPSQTANTTPRPETRILSLAAEQPAAHSATVPPRPVQPANARPSPATTSVPPQKTDSAEAVNPKPTESEAKLELTVTSDPGGVSVEINGVAVGSTPLTVVLSPGTNCILNLKKEGFVTWVSHYPTAVSGKFTLKANLTKEVFR